ncbi:MAG: DUF371 domain-containing protein [Candidatus Bathyarchaeia archaeon]
MEISETIIAYGHANIQATHRSTFEITKENRLSKRGNCIIAVSANKGLRELNSSLKNGLCRENSKLYILIEAGGTMDTVTAYGSPLLILEHPTEMVVRKSSYICSRTLAIHSSKGAFDLSRELVEKLKNPNEKVHITLSVKV